MINMVSLKDFKDELKVIQKAPIIFAISLCILFTGITIGEYYFYRETLSAKDSLIKTLKDKLAEKEKPTTKATEVKPQIPATPVSVPTKIFRPSQTGPATTQGDNSPAITGDKNSIIYGEVQKKEDKK
jgi:hypothetical protein